MRPSSPSKSWAQLGLESNDRAPFQALWSHREAKREAVPSPKTAPNTYEILCRVLGRDQAVTVKLLLNF
jgi:hypothetical protein